MGGRKHPQRKRVKPKGKKRVKLSRKQLVAMLDATKPAWTQFEKMPDSVPAQIGADEGWINSRYQVWIYRAGNPKSANDWNLLFPDREEEFPTFTQLSIKSLENDHYAHDWRDLQRIKNELMGHECEAVELYPSMKRIVDTSNQFHLWVIENDGQIPVGWPQPDVIHKEEVEKLINGSRQRAFEDGFLGKYESEVIRSLDAQQIAVIREKVKRQEKELDKWLL